MFEQAIWNIITEVVKAVGGIIIGLVANYIFKWLNK